MSNLDERTLGWKRPRTLDGRRYPLHLREFEAYDSAILAVLAEIAPATFDDITTRLEDPKACSALPGWLTSAGWRGLIEVEPHPSSRSMDLRTRSARQRSQRARAAYPRVG